MLYFRQQFKSNVRTCVLQAILHPQATRQSITPFSLRMHITCQLCQAGHACTCPLPIRKGEQAAPRDALVLGSWQMHNIHRGKVHVTTASDAHSQAYCIHMAMPGHHLCPAGHPSMCPLATWEGEQAAPCDALVHGVGYNFWTTMDRTGPYIE